MEVVTSPPPPSDPDAAPNRRGCCCCCCTLSLPRCCRPPSPPPSTLTLAFIGVGRGGYGCCCGGTRSGECFKNCCCDSDCGGRAQSTAGGGGQLDPRVRSAKKTGRFPFSVAAADCLEPVDRFGVAKRDNVMTVKEKMTTVDPFGGY